MRIYTKLFVLSGLLPVLLISGCGKENSAGIKPSPEFLRKHREAMERNPKELKLEISPESTFNYFNNPTKINLKYIPGPRF